nr:hypothetical protein [Bacteroidota bacterium]
MEKLNLFDSLVFIVPGMLLAIFIHFLLLPYCNLVALLNLENEIVLGILILFFSYTFGLIISAISNFVESMFDKLPTKHPLIKYFSPEYKDGIGMQSSIQAQKIFDFKIYDSNGLIDINKANNLFDLMREYVNQKDKANVSKLLITQASFLRNLMGLAFICLLITVAVFSFKKISHSQFYFCNTTLNIRAYQLLLAQFLSVFLFRYMSVIRYKQWFKAVILEFHVNTFVQAESK